MTVSVLLTLSLYIHRKFKSNCSLVVVVFNDTMLEVNPVFQLHAEAILIFPRVCGGVNINIPWVLGQLLGYK